MSSPLRVAIVGAGPAGFYSAEHLLKHTELDCAIDIFERLPAPYGLVRYGVAPDHQKIKSVTKVYDRIASAPNVRFFGDVEIGPGIAAHELDEAYHAVILTVGAPVDRRMGIPGEDLRGSHSATDFVAWYNGHPDYRDFSVDLSHPDVVVIGNGNVAVDVARILASPLEALARTDIADHALEALRTSAVRTITMVGRRGPAQAAFTPKEIRELGEIDDVTVLVDPADLDVTATDEDGERVLGALRTVAGRSPSQSDRTITLRFLASPTALEGDGRVEQVALVENELVDEDGTLRAHPTDRTALIPAGLVLRAVGYRGSAIPGYPFDERAGVIPNDRGRVSGDARPGRYVSGWIKRGPTGVIGTNKSDAHETVTALVEDFTSGRLIDPPVDSTAWTKRLATLQPEPISWTDWQRIDGLERERGEAEGRPRRKFVTVAELRDAARRG